MKTLKTRLSTLGLGLCLLAAAGAGRSAEPVFEGSAAPAEPAAAAPAAQYGVVQSITGEPGAASGPRIGKGAIIGGVVGALAGRHLAGRGDDKTIATALGALGGAFIGHQIEKHREARAGGAAGEVRVLMDDGAVRRFPLARAGELRVGDRVRVDGEGLQREPGGPSANDAIPPRDDASQRPTVYNGVSI